MTKRPRRVIDLNGPGCWSAGLLAERYLRHARRLRVRTPISTEPPQSECGGWVYPLLEPIIAGIDAGDPACAAIAIELIEEDRGMPYGAILKSNAARAHRRFPGLSDPQKERIRARVVGMLETGIVPREYREYAKLLRTIGIGAWHERLLACKPRNHLALRYGRYLREKFRPTREPSETGER